MELMVMVGLVAAMAATTYVVTTIDDNLAEVVLGQLAVEEAVPVARAKVTEVEIDGVMRSIVAIPLTGAFYVKKGRKYQLVQGEQIPDGVPLYKRTLKGKRAVYELA